MERDRLIRIALAAGCVLVRVPLFSRFDFVSFDGTFYLNQARALLHGSLSGGSFPIGYPLLVAPVLALVRDPVLAGMLVSLLAAVGSTLVFFELARCFVSRTHAAIGAGVLAVTPLFVQTSLLTMSESAYVFWLLLGLWMFAKQRMLYAGLALGMATITRPEGLAVAGALIALDFVKRRRLALPLAFVAIYAIGVTTMSVQRGELTVLSRAGAYKAVETPWVLRESSIEYEGKEQVEEKVRGKAKQTDRLQGYARRMPASIGELGRQLLPALPLLALLGVSRRRLFILAAFLPLLAIPLFTEDRGHVRWLVPYLPPLILYGLIGLEQIRGPRMQTLARGAVVLCALLSPLVNRSVLTGGLEREFVGARDVGKQLARRLQAGDRIADRKPYLAFYAGAPYLEIPVAPYHETVEFLARNNVRFLSLHQKSIARLRPALRPLLFDETAIRGEVRYHQVTFEESGEVIYEREREGDPLVIKPLTPATGNDYVPSWSPDGTRVAFRRNTGGKGSICVLEVATGDVVALLETVAITDFLAWSPDGRRIAFAAPVDSALNLHTIDVASRRVARLTNSRASDFAASWCRNGEIAYASTRGGNVGVWLHDNAGGDVRLSPADRPFGMPSLSPDGRVCAWIDARGRLVLHDRTSRATHVVAEPREILAQPAWSPQGDVVAVGAFDWGSADIYLIRVRDGRVSRVTSALTGEGMPSWSPDGSRIAITRGERKGVSLAVLENFSAYRERLDVGDIRAFIRPDDMRFAPPRS